MLRLVLLALSEGASISRKVLVMYIVQSLEKDFPQASKTSVGHVVQLLYRASCFNVSLCCEVARLYAHALCVNLGDQA